MNTQATAYEARQAIRASRAAQLIALNPKLVPVSDTVNSLVAAAKNIRIELKAAFPGVKFSVRTSRFSMGDSIHISWIDGPQCEQVDAITDKYAAGSFDGSTDSYSYSNTAWTTAFGDAKYVSTSREHSDAVAARVIDRVARRYGLKETPALSDWKRGGLMSLRFDGVDIHQEIHRALAKYTSGPALKLLAVSLDRAEPALLAGSIARQ